MYAVIKTGGKQYRVKSGDVVRVEKLAGAVGDKVKFDEVLMIGGDEKTVIGTPVVKGAAVNGEIVEQGKGRKIIVFKHKRRKGYRKKQGHRQLYTAVSITDIKAKASAGKAAKKVEEKVAAEPELAKESEENNGS